MVALHLDFPFESTQKGVPQKRTAAFWVPSHTSGTAGCENAPCEEAVESGQELEEAVSHDSDGCVFGDCIISPLAPSLGPAGG